MYSNFIFRFSFSIPEDATVVAKARMIVLINVFKTQINFLVFTFFTKNYESTITIHFPFFSICFFIVISLKRTIRMPS